MRSPALMAENVGRIVTFATGVKQNGFTDVVLLGMGGSSLAPAVLRAVLGATAGWPRFQMIDSTDPDAVRAAATPPLTTLYLPDRRRSRQGRPGVVTRERAGRRDRGAGAGGAGRGIRAMGNRDGRRGRAARHQPVR
ncbi:MAG: hypothetical protein HY048_06365 [Acidobacteria bacterium]|nr:hypothetical protein [Acidobacteriota bacterium]